MITLRLDITRFLTAVLVAATLLAGRVASAAEASLPEEYQIKAVFLYNFAKFIEWPGNAPSSNDRSLNICVLGRNPFGHSLEAIRGKSVRNRSLVVREISRASDADACSIVFISASERRSLPLVLETFHERNILTVSDIDRFARLGGMIGLVTQGDTIAFEINLGAAQRARLRINPQLLKLARSVYTEGK